MIVFNEKSKPEGQDLFFGPALGVSRFDVHSHPVFDKLAQRQLGYFWKPDEMDIGKDKADYWKLTDAERHIFTSNIKRQTMLDSIQGRSPVSILLPICSSSDLENWIITWSFFETIHSRTYSYIIQNVFNDPSEVLGKISETNQIVACANDISKYYEDLDTSIFNDEFTADERKVKLLECLYSVAALEGVRFYVSFACSWAFTEQKQMMEGNAKLIKLIARDENLHFAGTNHMLKILEKDPKWKKAFETAKPEALKMFDSVAEQEKDWAKYLFQEGGMLGLSAEILCEYMDYMSSFRQNALGLTNKRNLVNPLPWTKKWIQSSSVQQAPMEVVLTEYSTGELTQDVNEKTFKGFSL